MNGETMMNDLSENSLNFVDEMKEMVEKDYLAFHEYQMTVLQTLREFHTVCVKNGITYYLAYGTLLGLIRDGGQIPWDYDVDVWVPLSDAEKLMNAIDNELADRFHYTTRFRDKKCRTYTLKLAPKGYDCEVFHVDVFWLTGATNNEKLRSKTNVLGMKYHKLLMRKYTDVKYLKVQGKIQKIAYFVKRLPAKACPASLIEKRWKRLINKDLGSTEWVTDGYWVFPKEYYSKPILQKDRDGFEYMIPIGFKEFLTQRYGDYMKVPSIESRMAEFRKSLSRLNRLAKQ